MKPRAWITGAGGLIGHQLVRTAARWAPEWQILPVTRQTVDLTEERAVRSLWRSSPPALVIHCAAASRPAACEQDPAWARSINVRSTALLASLAEEIPFLWFSSDQVFDGTKGWYVETDRVNPINVYGETKAEAEQVVLANPGHTTIRVALTAGMSPTGDRSFVEDMCRTARKKPLTLFTDEYRTPVPAGVVTRAVWELVRLGRGGLYHLGGKERLSRLEIGTALALRYPELVSRIVAGSVREYEGPKRPADLSLCCDKLQQLLSFPLVGLRDWLDKRDESGPDLWDYGDS